MFIIALLIVGGFIFVNYVIAIKFTEIASAKGHGKEVHAFAMCFWLGIIGYLYVIALPNATLDNLTLKQQKLTIQLLSELKPDDIKQYNN